MAPCFEIYLYSGSPTNPFETYNTKEGRTVEVQCILIREHFFDISMVYHECKGGFGLCWHQVTQQLELCK